MGRSEDRRHGLTRRELLESAAATAPAVLLAKGAGPGIELARGASRGGGGELAGMNVILFITDQQRATQHFPRGWALENLPGQTRLRRHGLTFPNAFTNACMCSPARSTMMTGFFPAQHEVRYTLEEDMPADQYPQVELSAQFPNPASVMGAAGYTPVYKGKWHLSKPAGGEWVPADVGRYGFERWNPPDAGANQDIPEEGGGIYNNDGRFMDSIGDPSAGSEGVLQYLGSAAAQQQPFFLVVSLVNPHDVLFYPSTYEDAGYDDSWLEGDIGLPETVDEDLSTKPTAQRQFLRILNLLGSPRTPQQKRNYLNFYGNLIKASDAYLVNVLNLLTEQDLLDNTLIIETADHGEMGMAHGGMRQKNFNFYEESLRVPLTYSNPRLFPVPRRSEALVSHVDLLPTLASLFGAPPPARAEWQGVDYSRIVLDPRARRVQDYVVFTYDDFQSGQASGPYPTPPNHIVSLREARWKLAKYYDAGGNRPNQWEMYDLRKDPLETENLAREGYERTPHQERQLRRLKRKLVRVQQTRLQPL
jgi:choline-sulfatase